MFRLRIFHKGLILVLIPLIFDVFVFSLLLYYSRRETEALHHANKLHRISNQIHAVVRCGAAIGYILHGLNRNGLTASASTMDLVNIQEYLARMSEFRNAQKKMLVHLGILKELVRDDPRLLLIAENAEKAALTTRSDVNVLLAEIQKTDFDGIHDVLNKNRKKLDRDMLSMIQTGLFAMDMDSSASQDDIRVEADRQTFYNILVIALGCSIVLALNLLYLFSRNVSSRLAKLERNTFLLSERKLLQPPMPGSDEIAQLDASLHEAARALMLSEARLKQTFDNASDLICSLEENLHLRLVNKKACQDMLGVSSEALIGSNLLDIVAESDRKGLVETLNASRSSERLMKAEIKLIRPDKRTIDTIIIPHWVNSEKAFFCVLHDISDRKKAERIKQEVFAMVSHDMRAPLSSFANFIEMLDMGYFGKLSSEGIKFLEYASRSVEAMTRLVEDILSLERVRSGSVKPSHELVRVESLISRLADTMKIYADRRKVKINVQTTSATVLSDASLIEKILSNFLSNALKVAPTGSSIDLYFEESNEWATFAVRDHGPGIPENEIGNLFGRFYSKAPTQKRDNDLPSSGLGLSLARELAEIIGGKIQVDSKVGEGSTFKLLISSGISDG